MRRQGLALGLAAWLLVWCGAAEGCGLQCGELGLEAGLVGSARLIEQRALLGVHGFGSGAELPGLEASELERDALDLGVAPLDGLGLRVDALALLTDVSQHFLGHGGQCFGAQTAKVLGFEVAHIEHVHSVPRPPRQGYSDMRQLP